MPENGIVRRRMHKADALFSKRQLSFLLLLSWKPVRDGRTDGRTGKTRNVAV